MNWKIGFYPFLSIFFNKNKNKNKPNNYYVVPKGYIIIPNMYNYESNLLKIPKTNRK